MRWLIKNTIVAVVTVLFVSSMTLFPGSDDANARGGPGSGGRSGGSNTVTSLSYNEKTHLSFMREEEKLARDVYITLGEHYPFARVFQNIVRSEQSHTDAIRNLLDRYGLPDPVDDTEPVGVFEGGEWSEHFSESYTLLVSMGVNGYTTKPSSGEAGRNVTGQLAALHVGAFIEELDMHDIILCPEEIVDERLVIADETDCGRDYTQEEAIVKVYNNLLSGSGSHLRAYVHNIEQIIGEGKYQAQYLSQKEVDGILGR